MQCLRKAHTVIKPEWTLPALWTSAASTAKSFSLDLYTPLFKVQTVSYFTASHSNLCQAITEKPVWPARPNRIFSMLQMPCARMKGIVKSQIKRWLYITQCGRWNDMGFFFRVMVWWAVNGQCRSLLSFPLSSCLNTFQFLIHTYSIFTCRLVSSYLPLINKHRCLFISLLFGQSSV